MSIAIGSCLWIMTTENERLRASVPFQGTAQYTAGVLKIKGTARFPGDCYTGSLEPFPDLNSREELAFKVIFSPDKEPFAGPDLIGPVVYYARMHMPARVKRVSVHIAPGVSETITLARGWTRWLTAIRDVLRR